MWLNREIAKGWCKWRLDYLEVAPTMVPPTMVPPHDGALHDGTSEREPVPVLSG